MRKISRYLFAFLSVAGLLSCQKDPLFREPDYRGSDAEKVELSLEYFASAPGTKAAGDFVADIAGERRVSTYDVFYFHTDGTLDAKFNASSPTQTGEAGAYSTGGVYVSNTTLDVYVVANAPSTLRDAVTDRAALLAAVSQFTQNTSGQFVMVGYAHVNVPTLAKDGEGVRHYNGIILERIANKVLFRNIRKDFPDAASQSATVTLKGAWIVMAAKEAKYTADSAPVAADASYYNYDSDHLETNPFISAPSLNIEVQATDTEVDRTFYFYPNKVAESASASEQDFVTKLVLRVGIGAQDYFYPIGITQTGAARNLVYDIERITLRMFGNKPSEHDINDYIEPNAALDVAITVKDWNEALVDGTFNRELDEDYNFAGTASASFQATILNADGSVARTITVPVESGRFRFLLPELGSGQRYTFEGQSQIQTITALPERLRQGPGTMENTFRNCTNLEELVWFDTSGVTSFLQMFGEDAKLRSVPMLDTSDGEVFRGMFVRCSDLELVPSFDTSKATDVRIMFKQSGITSCPSFDFSHVWDAYCLFEQCTSLTYIPDLSFDTIDIETLGKTNDQGSVATIFKNCTALEHVGAITFGRMRTTVCVYNNTYDTDFASAGNMFAMHNGGAGNYPGSQFDPNCISPTVTYLGGFIGNDDLLNLESLPNLTRESMVRVFDGLAVAGTVFDEGALDLTHTHHRVILHPDVYYRLSTEDIQIAIRKGWDVRVSNLHDGSYSVTEAVPDTRFRYWEDEQGYHVRNFVCDGTSGTAFNTGKRLFDTSVYPNGWRLTFDLIIPDGATATGKATFATCMSEAGSPWPGMVIRRNSSNPALLEVEFNPGTGRSYTLEASNHIVMEYNGTTLTVNVNGTENVYTTTVPSFNWPLALGGSLASYNAGTDTGTWQRLAQCEIPTLDVVSLSDPSASTWTETRNGTEFSIVGYSDCTEATAHDTGIRLFDGSYPNGFHLVMNFTLDFDDPKFSQSTFIACKDETISGVWPGFALRYAGGTSKVQLSFRPNLGSNSFNVDAVNGVNTFELIYDGESMTATINGVSKTASGTVAQNDYPLTFGGTYSSYNPATSEGVWYSDRFSAFVVNSFTLVPLPGPELAISEKMVRSEISRASTAYYLYGKNGTKYWNYQLGLELLAFLRVHETYGGADILSYANAYFDGIIASDGSISGGLYSPSSSSYELDRLMPGRDLFYLIDNTDTGDAKYRSCLDRFMNQLYNNETYSGQWHQRNADGCFYHKSTYPNQVWLDGLYMYGPLRAEYASRYLSGAAQTAAFDDLVSQLLTAAAKTKDNATGLYRHAYDASGNAPWRDPATDNQSYFCFLRALGWFAMATVDILDYLPVGHSRRAEVIALLSDIIGGALDNRASAGLWENLPGVSDSRNYVESSGSCMLCYAILKGARKGYLDGSYQTAGVSIYEDILDRFVTESGDLLSLSSTAKGGNPGGNASSSAGVLDNYFDASRAATSNDPHGIGPFILASLEYEALN